MNGLRGVGGEEGILATALNIHFKMFGSEHWHVVRKSGASCAAIIGISHVSLKETVRRQALPAWIDHFLHDLCPTRQIRLAKTLGLNVLAASGAKLLPASGGISASRRHELIEEKKKCDPDTLPSTLWRTLGMAGALPEHSRPGKQGRLR